ncbi:hypothetical protein QQS21_004615 [Conoideocrella luteorostrata]|uniref:Pierisin-like domain-containing protein n=1 Tax=Conoideocrella luteorostrata TaxID=1105319 RepID=A0AAJ0G1G8_9HYPO|nr:hypothetical protein QQS21_004615 [Conoideocrella luteorostrata]
MRIASLFVGAALPWLRDASEEVAHEVFRRIDRIISTATRQRELTFRPNWVYGANGNLIPAAAELLFRCDHRPPGVIFKEGFQPRRAPTSLDEFRKLDDLNLHLHRFINDQTKSIFVSTTRPDSSAVDSLAETWRPLVINGRYCYEIFAHGGIDVLATFERRMGIKYPEQQEIIFIGGVRSELIRTATEYNDRGEVVSTWYNTWFNSLLNGNHAPRLNDLPNHPKDIHNIQFRSALNPRADPLVENKIESATHKQGQVAALAEEISEKEFAEVMASYIQKSQYKQNAPKELLLKSYSEVRKELNYFVTSESKLWGSFGKLKKALMVAGGIVWVKGMIHTFMHNTTVLERTAAVTEIMPIVGCGLQAISRADKKKKIEPDDANDTGLCLVADVFLLTPLFPIGVLIHIERGIMSFFSRPDLPSMEEIILVRDEAWKKYLNDSFHAYLYSHPFLYPNQQQSSNNSVFREEIEKSLAIEARLVLFEGARTIGIIRAIAHEAFSSSNSSSEEAQVRNNSIGIIQELRDEMPKMVVSRQRQFLLDLPSVVNGRVASSLSHAANQLNQDIIGNITSTETAAKYYKYYTHARGAPGPPPNNIKEVHVHLEGIARHLRSAPPSLPGHLDTAFTMGQSRGLANLDPDILSPQAYLREKAPDMSAEDIHTICMAAALSFAQFLRGSVSESQLSTWFPNQDAKSTQEFRILLALKFGRVHDELKHKNYQGYIGWEAWYMLKEDPSWPQPIVYPVKVDIESYTYRNQVCP